MNCPYCKKEFHSYEMGQEESRLVTIDGRDIGNLITLECPHCKTFLAAVSPPSKPAQPEAREDIRKTLKDLYRQDDEQSKKK